jgi:hypothetical protein
MERTPGSNDLLMLPSALDVDPDLGRHARRISFETHDATAIKRGHLSIPRKLTVRSLGF